MDWNSSPLQSILNPQTCHHMTCSIDNNISLPFQAKFLQSLQYPYAKIYPLNFKAFVLIPCWNFIKHLVKTLISTSNNYSPIMHLIQKHSTGNYERKYVWLRIWKFTAELHNRQPFNHRFDTKILGKAPGKPRREN